MRRWPVAALMMTAIGLSGCLGFNLPDPEEVQVSAPAGRALPVTAKAMIFMTEQDRNRPLMIEVTRGRDQETEVKDGKTLERASRAVLGKVFTTVDVNNPAMAPNLVVKVVGKPHYSRVDNLMKTGCILDVFLPDGTNLGQFIGRYDYTSPSDFSATLAPSYALCLKAASESMLAAPSVQRALASGFPPVNPKAQAAFFASLSLR